MISIDLIQENAVELLIKKYENEPSHCRQVTKLVLAIFDSTKAVLHNYDENERNLLKYGSLLHDIGYSVEADKHNKHSYNLIIQSKIDGLIPEELDIVANIARYHRGALPSKQHKNFSEIKDPERQKLIKVLSSFLRIADGLDRTHTDAIQTVKTIVDKEMRQCTFIIHPRSINCTAEIYAANKKKDLFEEHFNLKVNFRVEHI